MRGKKTMIKENNVSKYKLTGGNYSNAQYFNHLDAIANRVDVTKQTIKKAIKENDGYFKNFRVELNNTDKGFNDFEEGDLLVVDGITVEVVSADYENIIVVKNESLGTGTVSLKTMELVSGLIFESDSKQRRRQNTKTYIGG